MLVSAESSGDHVQKSLIAAEKERNAGNSWEAVETYRRAALEYPAEPKAAEAHREAILCLVDLMRASSTTDREALVRAYVTLLNEHLVHFSTQPTADEVRLWQGQLLVSRGDFSAAIAALQQIPPASTWFLPSVKLVAQCYSSQLQASDGGGEASKAERAQLLASATQFLQPIIVGKENRWPASWTEVQREATLELARLHLRYSNGSSAYAEQLLTAALRWGRAADDEEVSSWRDSAQALLVIALARRGKFNEARFVVDELNSAPPALLLETLDYLEETTAEPQVVGELSLVLVSLIDARHKDLDESQFAKVDRHRAAALAATGDWAGAATQYAAIAAASPDDGEVQEKYAAFLAQSDSPEHLRLALAQWSSVEKRSRRGGERWLRARQARIETLARLGEQAEADKLGRLTRLLYPDWEAASANAK
jgi:hypothetical protein